MNNIQSDVILEFQKSIDNMARFGQEMETLDARFGRLDQRIDAMRSSLSGLQTQVSRGAGGNLRQSLTNELNNLISGNGIVLQQLGSAGLTIKRETLKDVFDKVEVELNQELRKYVRNMHIDIDPNYASGQKLPISNEDFNEINREVAKVIKLQIKNLVNAIQRYKSNLIKPDALEGLQITVGKETVLAFVNKIKNEVLHKLANPNIAEVSDMKISKADLGKVIKEAKTKIMKALDVDLPELSGLDVSASVKRIPKEIDENLKEYVNKTVAGINGAIAGKAEIPIGDLSKKVKRILARELDTTVDQLDKLGSVDLGSVRGAELKAQLERVAKTIDKKLSKSIQEEIDGVVKAINDVEITPEPKLKRHLVNQINRINNSLINKIREQVDIQVNSIIQEINEVQSRPKGLNRDAQIRNAGDLDLPRRRTGGSGDGGGGYSDDTRRRATVSHGASDKDTWGGLANGVGMQGAIINTIRHVLAGSMVGAPMMMMYQAVETFKTVQIEQIKMMQNLMLKDDYQKSDGRGGMMQDSGKVQATVTDLQRFVGQQSMYYGTDYNQLTEVAGIASRLLDTPAEMKKFVQLSAQMQTIDPGSNIVNIATGMESVMAQFGLNIGQMQKELAEPLAAVTQVTNATVEQIMDALKRSGSTMENSNVDPETAVVLAATSIQSTGLEGANIGNFYNSILNRLQSEGALSKLDELRINPYNIDEKTGAKELRPADQILTEVAQKLSTADDASKRDTYQALFGAYQGSKGAATVNQMMVKFAETLEKVRQFNEDSYVNMITQSLDNPLVNVNRARESWSVALNNIVTDLSPVINRVSYAMMNLADKVSQNADTLIAFGDAMAHVLVGMLMMRGIKWGAGKVWGNVSGNADIHRQRSGFINNIEDLRGRGLLGDDFESYGRKDVKRMQSDPVLQGYLRELNGMSQQQSEHFKQYLDKNNIRANDLPTLFAAMDEARSWTPDKDIDDDEAYKRAQQYNNRLSTRPELANVIDPNFLRTLNNSTANRGSYDNHIANVEGYAQMSKQMSGMSQRDFDGFEESLMERHRNGLPPVSDIESLNRALDDYKRTQQEVNQASRQASPTYNSVSNAIRGMNEQMSRTQRMSSGFTKFLKDLPNLGRGALSSVKDLAGGIAKLAAEIAAAIGLAEGAKALSESYLATDDQRKLIQADDVQNDMKALGNTLKAMDKGGAANVWNGITGLYYSALNGISKGLGGTPSNAGAAEIRGEIGNMNDLGLIGEMMTYYGYSGSNYDFASWLTKRTNAAGDPISVEDSVAEFYANSGKADDVKKLREEAAIKQYEQNKLKEAEEQELEEKARKAYEEKYGKDNGTKFPTINPDEVISRVNDNLTKIKNQNTVQTLNNLMGGMKTDSEEYISMRQQQVKSIKSVLDDEIKVIDTFINNATTIMANTEEGSDEYNAAKEARDRLKEQKQEILDSEEADILQQEYQQEQEAMQSRMGRVTKDLQRIDLLTQAKELAAAYNMDTNSKAYYDTMKSITLNKIASMKEELAQLQEIQTYGDLSEEQANQVLQLQNSIANEQAKIKEFDLATISLGRQRVADNNSERENELLELKLRTGNPDDSSPILRNKRIANAKAEVADINAEIAKLQARNPTTEGETKKIQQEIRDLQKQSLQAQLGILDEMKASAGTFNLPDGVSPMTRYEYLTRNNTHNTTTIGTGDVTVNITLPNVTNGMTPSQLQQVGQSIGQGLSVGRVGSLRSQQAMNPSNYRS